MEKYNLNNAGFSQQNNKNNNMFCKKCGRELIPGKRFCGGCGTPVEQAPQQMPQAPAQNQYAPAQNQYAPVQNRNAPAQQEKKDNKTKKIVAIILAVVIVLVSCAVGFAVVIKKKNDEKEEEELRIAVEEYTTKQMLDFYYDDYDADGKKEAFAIAGDGDKDEFKKADIIYVDRQKNPKTVGSDIDGHTNGQIHDGKTKFISVEKKAEKAEDNRSLVYGVKEKDAYQPEISGKYKNVRQEGKDIVGESPETGESIILTIENHDDNNSEDDNSSSGSRLTSNNKTGDVIKLGSYPQSKVTDTSLLTALDGCAKDWKSYNYSQTQSDYMKYADIEYPQGSGTLYRAVTFSSYRNEYHSSATDEKNRSVQDENGYELNKVYYFSYEPLEWVVIDPENGYVMCRSIIDTQEFQRHDYEFDDGSGTNLHNHFNSKEKTNYTTDYTTSTIRSWLNDTFYNTAFSEDEKAQIKTTRLTLKKNTYNSDDCDDKVFLPPNYSGLSDVGNWELFRDYYDADDYNIEYTDYSACQGLRTYTLTGSSYETAVRTGEFEFWVLSPDNSGMEDTFKFIYDENPSLSYNDSSKKAGLHPSRDWAYSSETGVVPVIRLG